MLGNLPHELAIATGLVAGTVVIHLIGLEGLMRLTDLYLRRFLSAWVHVDRLLVPLGIVLGLFVVHGAEIWLYALFFLGMGILPDLEAALYFSTSAYSTLGEAGAFLPDEWRVLGVLEGINGMLLLGWSTAFLFQVLGHLMESEGDHPLPKGAIARSSARAPRRKSARVKPKS
ncbi:two pore domain potassium channel family protein [Phenylobacterium kunshanense]|uniref:two pore domain potassium channel family protein n=1 Tax=Phenylobacterium kunshanense TaxID=1445034 RepID=UPI00197B43CA|nr:two pore domain potassium channel family protein [Phenylobacterium kunshanense]